FVTAFVGVAGLPTMLVGGLGTRSWRLAIGPILLPALLFMVFMAVEVLACRELVHHPGRILTHAALLAPLVLYALLTYRVWLAGRRRSRTADDEMT
ncbi:MAG: hypothetical protein AAF390_20865, partial [Pseudomonadota bacterium]